MSDGFDPNSALARARLLLDSTADLTADEDDPNAAYRRAGQLLGQLDVLPPLTQTDEWSRIGGTTPLLTRPEGPVPLTKAQQQSRSVLSSTPASQLTDQLMPYLSLLGIRPAAVPEAAAAHVNDPGAIRPISEFPDYLATAGKRAAQDVVTLPWQMAKAAGTEVAGDFGLTDATGALQSLKDLKQLHAQPPAPPTFEGFQHEMARALDPLGIVRSMVVNPALHELQLAKDAVPEGEAGTSGDQAARMAHIMAALVPVIGPMARDILQRGLMGTHEESAQALGDVAALPIMEEVYPRVGTGLKRGAELLGDVGRNPANAVAQMLAATGANRNRAPQAAAQALAEMKRVENAAVATGVGKQRVVDHGTAVRTLQTAMDEWRGDSGVYPEILDTSVRLGHEWDVTDLGQPIREVADAYKRADVPMPAALKRLDEQARMWENFSQGGGPTTGRLPQEAGATTALPRRTMNATELDQVLQELNAATGRFEEMSPQAKNRVQQSNPTMAAQVALRKAVREKLYNGLGEMGPGIRQIVEDGQRRWGQMSEMQKRLVARTAMAERQKTSIPGRLEQAGKTAVRVGTKAAIGYGLRGGEGAVTLAALDLAENELALRNARRKTISGMLQRAMRNQDVAAPPFGWQGPMHGPWPATTGPGGSPGGPGGGSPYGGGPGGGGAGGGAGFPIAGGGLPPNPNTVVTSPTGGPPAAGPIIMPGESPVRAGGETEPLPPSVDVSEARPGIDWEELGRRFTAHNNALQAAGQPQLTWRQFMKLVQKGGGGEAPPAAGVPVPRGPAPTPGAPPAAEALVEPTRTGVPATVARAAWNRMVELFPKELPELVKAFRESTGTKPKSKASKWASQTELEGPLADWLLSDMATRHSDLKDYQLLLERARTVIRKATPKPEAPPEGGVPPAAPVPEGPSGGPAAPPASPAPTPAAGARPAPRASREAAAAAKAVEVGSDNPVEVVRRQLVSRTPSGDALLAELTEGMAKKSSAFQIAKLLEGKSSKYHAKAKTIGERLIREREMGPKAVLEEKAAADGPDSAAAKALARMNEETARAVETLKRDSEDIRTGRKPPPMSDKSARITKGAVDEGFQQAQANLWHQIDSLEDQILDAMDTRGPEYERLKAEQARLLDLYETAWEGAVKRTGDSDLVQGWRDDLEGEPTPRQQTSLKRGAEQTVRNEERRQSEQAPILKAAGVLPKPTVEEVITQRVKAIKGNKAASAAVDVENQRVLDAYRAEADRVFGPEAGQLQAAFDAGKWPKDTSYESNYWNNKIAERLKQTPGEVFERVHGHKVGEPKPATPPVPKSKASSPEAVAARKARRDANWAEVEKSAAALKEETGVVQKHVARGAAALTRATEKLGRTPKPTLPRDLAGAKPRYNIGPNEYHPTFESDLDKAAYITAQKKPSLRDADYLKFVQRETGWSEAAVRAHGAKVRAALKEAVKDADDEGRVTLPDQMPDQSNPTAPVPKSKAAKARAAAQKKSPEAAVGGKFEDVFTKIKDEKKGRPQTYAKTTQADERTWAGLIDGKKVVVRTRPRTITEGESFLTPGNMRLRDSKVGQGGHFVDVEVLEGDSPAVRTKLQQLVEGSDTRPVLVRGKGEPFRTGHPGMPAAATRTTETAGTPRELMHRFGDATARAVRAMLDMEPWGPDAHPEDIALQEASAKLLHRMNGPKVRAELTPKEARILADHFRELADSPALLPEFEKGNSPNQQVRYAFSNFADKLETIAEPKPPPPPKSKAAKARAAKVQPAEPAEAPVSPAERAALKALQQRATSLESYESAADGAYTDAERAAATKEAAKLHEQWLDAMDKVRKQHGDEAGDVLHDNLLDEVWKDHRANMNKDGSLKVRPEPAAVPKSKAAAAREAKAAADAKAARDAEIDDVFQKPDPKTTKARMTKEIRNELQRILDEFDAQPYQGRVWTETPREDNYDPNRGKYTITAGHEGAPVFHDIREQTPALRRKGKVTEGTQVTRKVVEDAVRQLLDTGTVTRPLHEGALRVAELRAGSRKPGNFGRGISKPIIDAWWRERKEDVPFDVPKVKLTPEEEAQAARETEPLKGRAAREREAARKAAKKKR